jgi:hypothetical protein
MNDAQMAGTGTVGFCDPEDWTRGSSAQRFNPGYVSARSIPFHRAREGLEGNRDGRKLRSPLGDRIVCGLEPQPCGVQVLKRVSLVANSFQFFSCLGFVFAEEVDNF